MLQIVGCTLTAEKKRREENWNFAASVFFKTLYIFLLYSIKSLPLLTRAKLLFFLQKPLIGGDFSTLIILEEVY